MGSVTSRTIREALPEVAEAVCQMIRKRIPPGAEGGNFPGYAAQGNLKNAIKVGRITGGDKSPTIAVGLGDNTSELTTMIAYVHEYGMTIHARNAKYMTFMVQGEWVRTTEVTIKAKHFFSDGWDEARSAFPQLVESSVIKRWPFR